MNDENEHIIPFMRALLFLILHWANNFLPKPLELFSRDMLLEYVLTPGYIEHYVVMEQKMFKPRRYSSVMNQLCCRIIPGGAPRCWNKGLLSWEHLPSHVSTIKGSICFDTAGFFQVDDPWGVGGVYNTNVYARTILKEAVHNRFSAPCFQCRCDFYWQNI